MGTKDRLIKSIALLIVGVSIVAISSNFFDAAGGIDDIFTDQAKPSGAFVDTIGVNTHLDNSLGKNTVEDLIVRNLKEAGINHVREAMADYNYYRANLKIISDSGIKLDLILPYDRNAPTKLMSIPATISLIKRTLDAGVKINSIELPNEYNHHRLVWDGNPPPADWPKWLFEYTRDVYGAIKNDARLKNITVIAPTIASYHAVSQLEAAGPIEDFVDIGNFHWYCHVYWEPIPPPNLDNLCNLDSDTAHFGRLYTQKPTMITETNMASSPNPSAEPAAYRDKLVTDEVAAKYVVRRFFELFNRGFARTYLYQLNLHPTASPDSNGMGYYMPLINKDGSDRPTFTALRKLIALTADSTTSLASRELKYRLSGPDTLRRLVLQKSSGEILLILWNEVDSRNGYTPQNTLITFSEARMDIKSYDALNSIDPIATATAVGQAQIAVGDSPILLSLKVNPAPVGGGGTVTQPKTSLLTPGANGTTSYSQGGRSGNSAAVAGGVSQISHDLFILPSAIYPPTGPITVLQALGIAIAIIALVMMVTNFTYLVNLLARRQG